jgi:hypothetical protein
VSGGGTPERRPWPGGRRFAFTIVDDADGGTIANTKPVYDLLDGLGFRTTKAIWVLPPDPAHGFGGESLEDPAFRAWTLALRDRGFGIALHGVRSGDSPREMVLDGLRRFEEALGAPPRIHVNHAGNRDNVHWGEEWLPWWRRLLPRPAPSRVFEGALPGSPYFWGDVCRERIRWVRGRSFRDIDTLRMDPWMPYRDTRFPWVREWFSCSDGSDADRFEALLAEGNQERLERDGGACIVYTHFASGFVDPEGRVRPRTRALLERLAARPGWFVPAETLLAHLGEGRSEVVGPWRRLRLSLAGRRDRGLHGA